MQKTKEILRWHFTPSDFKYTAEHLFSNKTKENIKKSLTILENIAKNSSGHTIPNTKLIKDVYFLFQNNYTLDNSDFYLLFSKRDVRILVWALDYKPTSDSKIILFSEQFTKANKIIINKWKDSFIISLWHILIRNWDNLKQYKKQKNSLKNLLHKQCEKYYGNRKDILNVSTNINLFLNDNSTKNYANKLLKQKILIDNANSLVNQKETVLVYEYYSDVADKYIRLIEKYHIDNELISSIFNFLKKHNSKKTSLLTCSYLINNSKFNRVIDIIKNETVDIIGDPIKKHLWNYRDLTENQKITIELARNKLNALLNKQIIDVFFDRLVKDDRRKIFWLKFIDKIDDIKFVGSRANYFYLKNIERISKHVDYRYKHTRRNQSTCALVIYSKNYVFVEFTDTGALYIYKSKNFLLNLNNVGSMDDLKVWSTDSYACRNNPDYNNYFNYRTNNKFLINKEGRITHQGNWEIRVNTWMSKYYHD